MIATGKENAERHTLSSDSGLMAVRLLGISSSLREDSASRRAVERILEFAEGEGAEVDLLDLRIQELPMYQPGGSGPLAAAVAARVDAADALVLGSPDYHGSMSGVMKNFLDHHWEEFAGKLCGYVCASHEKGLTVMDQMRTAVRQCHGWSLPYGVSVSEVDFDQAGGITRPQTERRMRMTARDLVVYGAILREQFLRDAGRADVSSFAARYRPRAAVERS